LALGSGELILWPYLSANYGLGLIWGAVLGITFQYLLNMEIIRYTLVWGESVFVGFRRLSRFWPFWFVVSTFIPWSLPGFSSASAEIASRLVPGLSPKFLGIFILVFTGLALSFGKTLYKTMEWLQKTIILFGLPMIFGLVFLFTNSKDWLDLGQGLFGKGNGWWFFPLGVSLTSFLGAFAYSGAGGNLNLSQSYYVKEKGLGMGKYAGKITSIFKGKARRTQLEGETFLLTEENKKRFKNWWKLMSKEHFLVFWVLGLVTIVLLSVLAKSLVFGQADQAGLSFLYQEAAMIGQRSFQGLKVVFLVLAALMLYSTQLGVLESSSRIIAENVLLLRWQKKRKFNVSAWFYIALWGQISLGIAILLLGWQEPRLLLTLSAVLNALAMTVLFPLVWWLNKKRLNKDLLPSKERLLGLLIAFLFFVSLSLFTLLG